METFGTEGKTPASGQWQSVAKRVAAVIRVSGIGIFRQAVREVARERLKVDDERERREQARCEMLKMDGVLYRDGAIPKQPERDWCFHLESIRGSIKLSPEIAPPPKQPERPSPPACLRDSIPRGEWNETDKDEVAAYHKQKAKHVEEIQAFWPEWSQAILPVFEHAKQRGFPDDEDGDFDYSFDVCCWVPAELDPAKDPRNEALLPCPKRALTDAEKIAVLAAVYDAHWRGGEKIAPWGVSEDGEGPDLWPSDGERDDRRAALDYYFLFQEAQQLDDSDLPVVGSWLEELQPSFKSPVSTNYTPTASMQAIPEPPPPPVDTTLVFARDGDGYFIRAFGAEGHFKSTKGLARLEQLLRDAGKPVSMKSLVSESKPRRTVSTLDEVIETPEGGETGFQIGDIQQPVYDDEAMKNIQKELLRLDEEIDNAKYNCDTAEVDRLAVKKEQLLARLKKDLRLGGKSRTMTSETDRLRSAIANSLSGAYKNLRRATPPLGKLADHLESVIRAQGSIYIYAPQPCPSWSFDKPGS